MTRINCIPPSELTNKHLVAEYRELPRVFGLARRPHSREEFPSFYTLGTGHVKFFYNKLGYLTNRFHQIVEEMKRRGFAVNYPSPPTNSDPSLYGMWEPTPESQEINRKRIRERLGV